MEFEKVWNKCNEDNDPVTDDMFKYIARKFYILGLLHAAEQDFQKGGKNGVSSVATYFYESAALHEQAAKDLK